MQFKAKGSYQIKLEKKKPTQNGILAARDPGTPTPISTHLPHTFTVSALFKFGFSGQQQV
jgi:hypothetical protein